MKLIINTSNLLVGGGVQVSLSFINEIINFKDNEYHIFISPIIKEQLDLNIFPKNFYFYDINHSPASIKYRTTIVKQLNTLEDRINPDIVFSIFGPTYWTPKTLHLMGFAIPWIINPKSVAFNELSLKKRLIIKLKLYYQKRFIKKNSQFYVVETTDTKDKLSKELSISKNNIKVIGNTVSKLYSENNFKIMKLPERKKDEFRFITISHNYAHKNLKIIKEVLPYIRDYNMKVVFFVTLDSKNYQMLFSGQEDYIINLGPITVEECPSVYEQCDALFLPTLLECFSASYPEAMKMEKPILTSNYSFAKNICQDAALYFDPLNPKDISEKIFNLINNEELQKELICNGNKRLETFETSESRAIKYLELCQSLIKENK